MDNNDIYHHRISAEMITPKGKATPFLKCTFLTQYDRRTVTNKLNAICTSTGYIISRTEPNEVQSEQPGGGGDLQMALQTSLPYFLEREV